MLTFVIENAYLKTQRVPIFCSVYLATAQCQQSYTCITHRTLRPPERRQKSNKQTESPNKLCPSSGAVTRKAKQHNRAKNAIVMSALLSNLPFQNSSRLAQCSQLCSPTLEKKKVSWGKIFFSLHSVTGHWDVFGLCNVLLLLLPSGWVTVKTRAN